MDATSASILLIEDDPANVEMLRYLLDTSGFGLLAAGDGETGIRMAADEQPDLILLDIMMPGMDGYETCRRLKAQRSTCDIPVIFVTARADIVDKLQGFDIGAVDYITKPFQYEEVIARVRSHIIIRRQRLEIERLREEDRRYYEKLSQMKDDVLNTASHDLKNPLSVIMTSLHLLERHGTIQDKRGREVLAAIEASALEMRALISDLLDLASIETGQAVVKTDVSLHHFMRSSRASMMPLVEEKRINLCLSLPDEDCIAPLDPNRMNQVMGNLLSNAIKYTPENGDIELAAEVRADHVLIQARDSGLGIPADDLPHVFDKFYRIRSRAHMEQSGSGLGLSIAKSIVEQHGGEIWAESAVGQGTTINLTLPLR